MPIEAPQECQAAWEGARKDQVATLNDLLNGVILDTLSPSN